jgi:hypothetical protein
MESGIGYKEWIKSTAPARDICGWMGKQTITDPRTGQIKTINVNSRRLKITFETNMRVGYAIQREATANKIEGLDYRRYVCMMLPTSRDEHKKMHGIVLHKNDPWWKINTPPNGWNCHCKTMAISEEEAEIRGLEISKSPFENIADKDWAYNPSDPNQGWDNKSTPAIDQQPDYKSYGRPDLRDVKKSRNPAPELLNAGKNADEALEIMSKAILGDKTEMFVDTPAGKQLIAKEYLRHSVNRRFAERERYANYVLPTLKNPYEVYLTQYADGTKRMRYIGLFDKDKAFLAITLMRDGGILWNVIPASSRYADKNRKGWLIYGK